MKVRVTTIDVATGNQVGNSRVINYDRPASRQWLAKHCFWAYKNGYGVVSNNVADEAQAADKPAMTVEQMRAACIAIVADERKYEGSDFPVCNGIINAIQKIEA